jgi:beta-lactamase regulating signal transducer with metallopeptidase domain
MGRALLAAVTLLWLAGVVVLLMRLSAGYVWLALLRRAAQPMEASALKLLNAFRDELSVRRKVDLFTHPAVLAPVLIGGLRPAIVVPPSWSALPCADCRATLLHELTHVVHRDDWAKALEEVVRACFFFHPLVHWLLNRLDDERERRCDAAVVRQGVDPPQLARVLLDFAQRQGAGQPTFSLRTALPFFNRLTFKDRIHQLLENDMTECCTPLSRGRAVAVTILVVGLTIALGGFQMREGIAAQVSEDKPAQKLTPDAVSTLLKRLGDLTVPVGKQIGWVARNEELAAILRDLIQLGPNAVPELIVAMDTTKDEFMLRCLGFAVRGIGDKRAVPALIRALPRACVVAQSDFSFAAKDPELLSFLQKHDNVGGSDKPRYQFGRPINEIRTALQRLTGMNHGEDELVYVSPEGTPRQQFLQRSLYQRCAERWAKWWEAHWKENVADESYSRVNLVPLTDLPPIDEGFPQGPKATVAVRHGSYILESVRNPKAKTVFFDLDTGRQSGLPVHLRAAEGQPERLDDILAWAAREGFDLMGTEYNVPGEKSHFVLRGLGLTAWHIETDRWKTLETELGGDKPLNMGTRTDGLLAHFDAARGKYVPEETATFLFQTREGSYGVIFVGAEVKEISSKSRPQTIDTINLDPVGIWKGRRFEYQLITGSRANPEPPK